MLLRAERRQKRRTHFARALGTQNHFMTRYGFFEGRAELPKVTGIWAGILDPNPPEIAKGRIVIYGAEIDIMEFFPKTWA